MNSLSLLLVVLLALFILSLMDKDLIGNFSCDPYKEEFANSLKLSPAGIIEPALVPFLPLVQFKPAILRNDSQWKSTCGLQKPERGVISTLRLHEKET